MGKFRDLFRRESAVEQRAVESLPWPSGGRHVSGAHMNQSRALSLTPVWASIRLLSDSIGTLPLKAYRRRGGTREPMESLPVLFQSLVDSGQLITWLKTAVSSMALHGNACGLKLTTNEFGDPTTVMWRPRNEFYVDDSSTPGTATWYWMGRQIPTEQVVHIPWVSVAGRTMGLSPMEAFALSVNTALSAQEFGSDWFNAGGVPPGTFKNDQQTVNQEEAEKIKGRLVAAIRTREPIVYGKDWDFNAITIPPEQAQFVETQKLSATQVANIYGVPPEKVGGEAGGSMTYANVEQQALDFVTFALRPWLETLEEAFSALLPPWQYVKFNSGALVRADIQTRFGVYQAAREMGLYSLNEIRALEDLPPLPGGQGDDYAPPGPTPAALPPQQSDTTPTPIGRHLREVTG